MQPWITFDHEIFCVFVFQARHVEGGNTGLIPSQMLEEKRKAFVKTNVELPPAGK